ncbi:hypothetical protein Fot_42430 [Forsythia ovata]|uniref:Uncharacterized protein n=1 Tax=Forsythia ovata TaxID=205694 RepID=A0ABD1RL54_9LAMI
MVESNYVHPPFGNDVPDRSKCGNGHKDQNGSRKYYFNSIWKATFQTGPSNVMMIKMFMGKPITDALVDEVHERDDAEIKEAKDQEVRESLTVERNLEDEGKSGKFGFRQK